MASQAASVDDHAVIPRFPLEWPSGWTRTVPQRRGYGRFTHYKAAMSVISATSRLEGELDRLGAQEPELSTNVSLRLNGRPRSDEEPRDPGVACYFRFKGRATVLACDRYARVADNIAAIAAHIDALRRIERYGVGTIEQALAGYKALPVDSASDWRQVFGFTATEPVSVGGLRTRWKQRSRDTHPDRPGGSEEAQQHVNRARDYALRELGAEDA